MPGLQYIDGPAGGGFSWAQTEVIIFSAVTTASRFVDVISMVLLGRLNRIQISFSEIFSNVTISTLEHMFPSLSRFCIVVQSIFWILDHGRPALLHACLCLES